MNIDVIFEFLGKIIAYGGGGAAFAYLLFQYFGKTWIENTFSQRLEQLRHDQALELQRLKVEIDSLLSGTIKLQEREFEVLPGIWEKLDEALSLIRWLAAPFQQYADVDRMTKPQLQELLDSTEFTETQKQSVFNATKKQDVYQNILFWHRLHKVKKSFGDLNSYVARNGIFIEEELRNKLTKITDNLWSTIVDQEVGHDVQDWKMKNKGWETMKKEAEPLCKEIEEYIHKRLRSHGRKV